MKRPDPPSTRCSVLLLLCLGLATVAGAAEEPTPAGTGVRTLYLIRHGDYDQSDDRDPEVGKGLVPLGVAQARLLAHRLRGMPVTWSALYSSPMTRARQTAEILAERLPFAELQVSPLLSECTPPTWRREIMDEEAPEDLEACRLRLEAVAASFLTPSPDSDRDELVVCHGNVIRYLVTRALGVDPMSWLGMSIGNCSLTVVRIAADGSRKLLSFGDVGHIPPDLQTATPPGPANDLTVPHR